MNKIYFILIICLVCGLIGCPYIFDDSLVGAWGIEVSGNVYKSVEFTVDGNMSLYDVTYYSSDNTTDYGFPFANTGYSTLSATLKCFSYCGKLDYWSENNYSGKITVNYFISGGRLSIPEMSLNDLVKM
ncbi:MAG TPA: hypothetical protein PLG34_03555 [Spirochaetota bacterium]|jgi:hypothetical protein|nr:MAG: hypothetical protein BWX91_00071 [Spirochaetes bacterium ADurb.Bin133]HNZ26399.1 hypothetical protein [Spirochaetota bacterium]HPY87039.1 hypothetical protein [Spirochaetota bacterium]HQB61616.1 hypothetical protein [Spirochaetota bacterium]